MGNSLEELMSREVVKLLLHGLGCVYIVKERKGGFFRASSWWLSMSMGFCWGGDRVIFI